MFEKKRQGMPAAPKGLGILIGVGGKPAGETGADKGAPGAMGPAKGPPGMMGSAKAPVPVEEPVAPVEEAGSIADLGEKFGLQPEDAQAFADELFELVKRKLGGGAEKGLGEGELV